MRSVSERFLAALRSSHQVVVNVDVLFGAAPVIEALNVRGGSITYDRTAGTLARLNLDLAEPARLPTSPLSPLTPYGYELAVSRGIRFGDGSTEMVPLGVFPIQTAAADGVTLLTQVSAMDRSQRVREARFEDDYQIEPGVNYATAIQALIGAGVPGLVYAFCSTAHETPLLTFSAQDDRWEQAQMMASSIGCDLFFGGFGECVMRAEPDLSTATPVWTIDEGDGGVLIGASILLDRGPAYNRVIAFGSNTSLTDVPRGVATDDDPSSPSYYYGPFGRKPLFYASPFLATDEQAESAARARLASKLGVARSVDYSFVPNPALEAGDPILIRRSTLGLDEVHIADVLTLGLGADAGMTGQTRARQEAA